MLTFNLSQDELLYLSWFLKSSFVTRYAVAERTDDECNQILKNKNDQLRKSLIQKGFVKDGTSPELSSDMSQIQHICLNPDYILRFFENEDSDVSLEEILIHKEGCLSFKTIENNCILEFYEPLEKGNFISLKCGVELGYDPPKQSKCDFKIKYKHYDKLLREYWIDKNEQEFIKTAKYAFLNVESVKELVETSWKNKNYTLFSVDVVKKGDRNTVKIFHKNSRHLMLILRDEYLKIRVVNQDFSYMFKAALTLY